MPAPLPQGLTTAEARARLERDGANVWQGPSGSRFWRSAREVLTEPMFLLLLGAGGLYLLMGDVHEALALLGFVLIIMGVTLVQQHRTDRALDLLRDLSTPQARVWRDGQLVALDARELVVGDVLLLAEGDRVVADGWLLEAHELSVDESMLTGESMPVPRAVTDAVKAGTMVVQGQGRMAVSATGAATELAGIGQALAGIALRASPLREEVDRLTGRLLVVGVGLSVLLFLLLWAVGGGWVPALLSGITLAMSMLPQELPVIMIVFLALAARRLSAHAVLVRRLDAIETLGQTTVLCVDKTGTLTENRMALAWLCTDGAELDLREPRPDALPEAFHALVEHAVLASEIDPHDPMEQAIHRLADTHPPRWQHPRQSWQLAHEYELTPQLLAMSHLWRHPDRGHDVIAAKGAPEAVMALCHLDEAARTRLSAQAARMADQGLRVLGVARATHAIDQDWPQAQHDFAFQWLGLLGLADPLRAQVPQAVARCRQAGIRVVMITGDHPRTARAMALQAGIEVEHQLTGDELQALDGPALDRAVAQVSVFARVRPRQKLALVKALRAQGQVVAMTGDGVNDAPALKAAHIGIAMGRRGTDVAREASSLVLLEDDFSAIVLAIERGRRTFANLRQALTYTLAVHVPIAGLALWPVLAGWPVLLGPLHIAFLELVIDPACSLVFEAEGQGRDFMHQPPRDARESLLPARQVVLSLLQGGVTTGAVLALNAGLRQAGHDEAVARTAAFVLLVLGNAVLLLPSRVAGHGPSASLAFPAASGRLGGALTPVARWVLLATLTGLILVTQVPALAALFGFVTLSPALWAGCMALALALWLPYQGLKRWLGSRATALT